MKQVEVEMYPIIAGRNDLLLRFANSGAAFTSVWQMYDNLRHYQITGLANKLNSSAAVVVP